jgi:hypothetical protein
MPIRAILAGAMTFAISALWPAVSASAHGDDRPSVEEWVILALLVAGVIGITVLAFQRWRLNVNPHTGLPTRIKTRRFRGPLPKVRF